MGWRDGGVVEKATPKWRTGTPVDDGATELNQDNLGALPFVNRAIATTLGFPTDVIRVGINLLGFESPGSIDKLLQGRKSWEETMEILPGTQVPPEGREPQTKSEYIGRGVGEAISTAIPFMGVAKKLSTSATLVGRISNSIYNAMQSHPYMAMVAEVTAGGGGGLGMRPGAGAERGRLGAVRGGLGLRTPAAGRGGCSRRAASGGGRNPCRVGSAGRYVPRTASGGGAGGSGTFPKCTRLSSQWLRSSNCRSESWCRRRCPSFARSSRSMFVRTCGAAYRNQRATFWTLASAVCWSCEPRKLYSKRFASIR